MPTEHDERKAFWEKLHRERVERRARDLALYGPGYQKRRERIQDILTGKALLRRVEQISEGLKDLVEQASAVFDALSTKLGTKVIDVDRTTPPTFKVNTEALLQQDNTPVTGTDEYFAELNRALSGVYEGETFPAHVQQTAAAIAQAASTQVTAHTGPKAIALDLGNGQTAHVEGFGSFEEILAKIEYGFPENELPELLNLLRSQRDNGVEQVSDAFARQLFYRTAVRLAERCLNPEMTGGIQEVDSTGGIEGQRLQFFALAIKGLRPDIDSLDIFKDISRELHKHLAGSKYPGLKEVNIISIFNRVREPHVTHALHRATDAPSVVPGDDIAPLATDADDAARRLAEGHATQDAGTSNVVPLRPAPPKPEEPNGNGGGEPNR